MTKLFNVDADAETGEWLGHAKEIGTVDLAEFHRRVDTGDEHFDTFEHDGETCAVIVHWVDEAEGGAQ